MPSCAEIVALLSEYLDRDLPPDTCALIQDHLEICPNCGEAADSLRKTVRLCREYQSQNRPGPLPMEKQQELREVFERTMRRLGKSG